MITIPHPTVEVNSQPLSRGEIIKRLADHVAGEMIDDGRFEPHDETVANWVDKALRVWPRDFRGHESIRFDADVISQISEMASEEISRMTEREIRDRRRL